MRKKTIGEKLREGRVKKQLTLEDVEEQTKIPSPYLLALELDQFKVIPEDQKDAYLTQYSEFVGLSEADLSEETDENQIAKQENEDVVDELVALKQTENSSEEPETADIGSDAGEENFEITGSRASRHHRSSSKTSYFPIILLSLVAIAILIFVAVVTATQLRNDSTSSQSNSYSVVNASQSSEISSASSSTEESTETSSSSSSSDSLTMTSETSGNTMTVSLSNVDDSLEVKLSLSGADSSWVSVTNSSSGDSGTLLSSSGTSSYTATLPAGTTTSLITLGVTEGVTVTINGEELDTSSLSSSTLSYITLNIQ